MQLKRTATVVVVVVALAAWLAAAMTSGTHAPTSPVYIAPAIDAKGEALASEIARLHERLRPGAAPRQPARNLFAFTAARLRVESTSKPALSEAAAIPVAPAAPPFRLIGVAEDQGPDGPIRTAIVSGPGQVFLVKTGDSLTLRYRVSKISADVIELTDTGDGSTLRLALK